MRGTLAAKPKKAAKRRQKTPTVEYDNLKLLGPEHRADLLADLRQRTGLDIVQVQVRNIDLTRSTATLTISCDDAPDASSGVEPDE